MQFIQWMTNTIIDQDLTLVLVTHDRAFMETTCTKILELDHGRGYVHEFGGPGSYQRFLRAKEERRAAQQAAADTAKVCS